MSHCEENTEQATIRIANNLGRIADVVERTEAENKAVDRLDKAIEIWDGWYNSREEGRMRPPEIVLDEIGKVLYGRA